MRSWILLFCVVASFGAASTAQSPCTFRPVAGAAATAVGVLFPRGFYDDPPGRSGQAAVTAAVRLELGLAAAGGALASGSRVGADYGIVFAVFGPGEREPAARFLGAVTGRAREVGDDTLRLAAARVALAADDAEHLYPGDVLMTGARARLGADTPLSRPVSGVAAECVAWTPASLRRILSEPPVARAAVLGAVDDAWVAAISAVTWPRTASEVRGDVVCPQGFVAHEMTTRASQRSDSPYVGVAFAAPGRKERASFALAVEVARSRAFARLKLRGPELFARAPLVRWSWLQADPVLLFCRRGEDPVQVLPGRRAEASIDQEVAATRRDLEQLLEDLRTRAPSDAELRAARETLAAQLAAPGLEQEQPWAREPATYPGKLQLLLLRPHHAVEMDRLVAATAADVAATLARFLAPGRASWHAVVPRPRESLGYRRR